MAGYELSAEVENDIFEIWSTIAEDSLAVANRVEDELRRTFGSLAGFPGQGRWRRELSGSLRFRPVWDYLVAYPRTHSAPWTGNEKYSSALE